MLECQPIEAELGAARFRGEFLQLCALIEDHLCTALDRLVVLGEIKRPPYLFGQKFERVRKSVAIPGLWKHREHVEPVLRELQAFVDLRGTIGHAVMSPATIDGKAAVSWQTPGNRNWSNRKTMTTAEMDQMLAELQRLTEKFRKQPLISPASSPPRPSRAAAGGP